MREYVADRQVGKRMCRQRRRGMLVHKVGVAVLVLSLCGMLVADAALVRRAGGFSGGGHAGPRARAADDAPLGGVPLHAGRL